MIHFNNDSKLNPTIIRRRIALVHSEISNKKNQLNEAKEELEKFKLELIEREKLVALHEKSINSLKNQKKELNDDLEEMKRKSNKQVVTDHAVVRYIERVLGIDIQSIRDQMTAGETKKIREIEGDECIDRGGYSIMVEEGLVTTVITDDMIIPNQNNTLTQTEEN